MRVAISVLGRFHAFQLAQQLQKRNALAQVITSYPKWKAVEFDIPSERISSFVWLEAMRRMWHKVASRWYSQYFFPPLFDRVAAKALRPGADLFVGWSGSSLKTLRRAKALGMITVLERCSSHMRYQQKILTEEYALIGKRFNETHPKVIEQEILEYEEADYIAIPSAFVHRTFLAEGVPESKLMVVPYGSDLSHFRVVPKEDNTFRVLFHGTLSIRKGVHYLLQAFSELDLPGAELWFVGTVTEEIKPFVEKYQSPKIVIHGYAPLARLPWYHGQANVFCLPSIEEGMARVMIQAMGCGLPVICTTNSGGEGDLIREGVDGFVIPIRDVGALKDRIRWCYEHQEECRAMGRAACDHVAEGFSWDAYGERIDAAYTAALAASRQHCEKGR